MKISNKFPPGYVDDVFAIWYNAGKPSAANLYRSVPEWEFTGEKPTLANLKAWMHTEDWIDRVEQLDLEVQKVFTEKQIVSKVEMFERHAQVGRAMQQMSLDWLEEHKDELTPGTAVRMLVDGIEIEQGAAGIPDALKKMMEMKDEDLKNEIAQLIADTPIDVTDN